MKTWKSQFKDWLKEICPYDRIEPYVQFDGYVPESWGLDESEVRQVNTEWSKHDILGEILKIRIFSRDNYYAIVAKEKYLGCTVSKRKSRAGENWSRGSDLPDGKFNRETWKKIKHAIVRYELVKVVKIQSPMEDEDGLLK